VIVATRLWRNSLVCLTLLTFQTNFLEAMVWDNRYFPWFNHLYTGTDSRVPHMDGQVFFLTGGEAFRYQMRANKDEQIITFPELYGELDLVPVANAIVKTGKPNPIPEDWQWLSEIKAQMPASLKGQGAILSGYVPVVPHVAIGASALIMKLNSFVNVVPGEQAINQLNLQTPGNQVLFDQTVQRIYQEIDMNSTSFQQVGVGDIVLYTHIYDVHEYKYKFRKLDWGVWAGIVIPSGLKYDPYNLASVGFGSQYSGWGWFIAPRAEFELRDDLKFGIMGRLSQRFDTCFQGRIPVSTGKKIEQSLFAPLVGSVSVDQGTNFGVTSYFIFEDIRAGLGAQIQYTINYHENDRFSARIQDMDIKPNFRDMSYYSSWVQEYFTIKVFYDVAHDKEWKTKPFAYFVWDVPMNHLFGRGFAKTNKVALGCTVNF